MSNYNTRLNTEPSTVSGTYGGYKTPCDVYTYNGWYAVEGSSNVNRTDPRLLVDGVDVEELPDCDMFAWPNGIHSEEELEQAVEA